MSTGKDPGKTIVKSQSRGELESPEQLLETSYLSRLGPELLDMIIIKLPLVDRLRLKEAYPDTILDAVVRDTLKGLCLMMDERNEEEEDFEQPLYGYGMRDFGSEVPLLLTPLKGFSPPNSSEEIMTIGYETLKKMLKLTSKSNIVVELKRTFSCLITLKVASVMSNDSKIKVIRKLVAAFASQLKELQIFIDCSNIQQQKPHWLKNVVLQSMQIALLIADLNKVENYPKLKHLTLYIDERLLYGSFAKDHFRSDYDDFDRTEDIDSEEDNEDEEDVWMKAKGLTLLTQVEEAYLCLPSAAIIFSSAFLGGNPNLKKLGIIMTGERTSSVLVMESIAKYPSLAGKVVHIYNEDHAHAFHRLPRLYSSFERPLQAHQFGQLTHLNASLKTSQYVAILKALGDSGRNGSLNRCLRELFFYLQFKDANEINLLKELETVRPLPSVSNFYLFLRGLDLKSHETFWKIAPIDRLFACGLRHFFLDLGNCLEQKKCTSCGETMKKDVDCVRAMLKPILAPCWQLECLNVVPGLVFKRVYGNELLAEIKAAVAEGED